MLDALLQTLLGGSDGLGQAGEAEELRRPAVDHLLMDPDFVEGQRSAAFHADGLLTVGFVQRLFLNQRAAEDPAVMRLNARGEVAGRDAGFLAREDVAELEAVA